MTEKKQLTDEDKQRIYTDLQELEALELAFGYNHTAVIAELKRRHRQVLGLPLYDIMPQMQEPANNSQE